MSLFHAVLLGILEGITEFLPISSTGHLILAQSLLKIPPTDFGKSFEIFIQLGAILAVVVLYLKRLFVDRRTLLKVIAAFIPTGIIGLLVHSWVKAHLLGSTTVVLWSLLIGGLFLIIFEQFHRESAHSKTDLSQISYKQAVIIGLFQSLAIVPGVSRAAATIVGGLLLGLNRKTIVEFSFLLAIPTMAAASGLDLLKSGASFSGNEYLLLAVGFVTAFVVALFSIRWLLKFIQKHTFTGFGMYRVAIAIVGWIFIR